MSVRISQVDAFTDRKYAGNPAAVCILSEPADERWMQDVAAEMNLSETAFAQRLGPDSIFSLRWFTPKREVDLCGHATLATAHVLWEEGHLPDSQPARFETRSGLLTAKRSSTGIEFDFPSEPVNEEVKEPGELAELTCGDSSPDSICRSQSVRSLGRRGNRGTGPRLAPGYPPVGAVPGSRGDRDRPRQLGRPRLRFTVLRAPGRCRRRSGLWLGALLSRPVLGGEARSQFAERPPSLLPRRCRQGPRRGSSRRLDRPSRHGIARRVGCGRATDQTLLTSAPRTYS